MSCFVNNINISTITLYCAYASLPLRQSKFLMMKFTHTLLIACLFSSAAVAQQESNARMKEDIFLVASDDMSGRFPGTPQANQIRDLIQFRMEQYGLQPMGEDGYLQEFPVPRFVKVDYDQTGLKVGKMALIGHQDFYPVAQSSNAYAKGKTVYVKYGIETADGTYNDYEGLNLSGRVAVLNISSPDGIHPHSKYLAYHSVSERIKVAISKGAVAVLLINPEKTATDVNEKFKVIRETGVPVAFIRNVDVAESVTQKSQKVHIQIQQEETSVAGYNVIGYLNNGAQRNVVIGAHYDHIGMGEENSLYAGPPAIHNGADDNGSGTVLLMELMRDLALERRSPQFNYIIQFYSAEELGLIGSKHWTNHPTFPIESIEFMINYDMVGKLRENRMQISGTGTATEWDAILDSTAAHLDIKRDPNGIGPSDQTSFYLKDKPVLHFFTGTHPDYHKPTDDPEGIMIQGMVDQKEFTHRILDETAKYPKLSFKRTKSAEQKEAPRFSVTLGVIPDYLFSGPGLRIDGTTEGKPAAAAGMQAGDIILEIGEFKIEDIYAYMRALGGFKKGDTTQLKVKRGEEIIEMELTF